MQRLCTLLAPFIVQALEASLLGTLRQTASAGLGLDDDEEGGEGGLLTSFFELTAFIRPLFQLNLGALTAKASAFFTERLAGTALYVVRLLQWLSGTCCSSACIIARKKSTLRIGLSRCERCCEYIAPQWKRSLQHVSERRSTAPTNDEKSDETKPSVSPPT